MADKVFTLAELESLDESFIERTTGFEFEVETTAGPLLLHGQCLSTMQVLALEDSNMSSSWNVAMLARVAITHVTPPPDAKGQRERMSVPMEKLFINRTQFDVMAESFASALGARNLMELGVKTKMLGRLTDEQRAAIRFIGRSGEKENTESVETSDAGADATTAETELSTSAVASST